MKMKKALIPPMTLMTLLMSGTNMAVSTVTLIQTTVRTTLQRLSKECVTIPRRLLSRRRIKLRMTDLFRRHAVRRRVCKPRRESTARPTERRAALRWRSPPEEQNNRVDGDDGYSKKQSGDDHHHVVAWIGHQNICGDLLSKGHEAVHACEEREGALRLVVGDKVPWRVAHSADGSTCQGVDQQAEEHGERGDAHPVGELLVLHAAVDGNAGFVALQAQRVQHTTMGWKEKV